MTEPNLTHLIIGIVTLLVAACAASFYAGWRSAHAYLESAEAVTEMAKEAKADRAEFNAALDNSGGAAARLTDAVAANTEQLNARLAAVTDALGILFDGFERAGFVKRASAPTGLGRQHGEGEKPD